MINVGDRVGEQTILTVGLYNDQRKKCVLVQCDCGSEPRLVKLCNLSRTRRCKGCPNARFNPVRRDNEKQYTRQEWADLAIEDRGTCDEWQGTRDRKGYGLTSNPALGSSRAHRQVWMDNYGTIPIETPCVLHHCDNPPCYRLSHLFLGTDADNTEDKMAKGRWAGGDQRGEKHPQAKLTDADIISIRARVNVSRRALAEEFGVSESAISMIINRRTWDHVV